MEIGNNMKALLEDKTHQKGDSITFVDGEGKTVTGTL
jgi:hypothetical protein